jgi:glyoxylase-like metal-dependent hydrolase (beta-lactamase superfamily II)
VTFIAFEGFSALPISYGKLVFSTGGKGNPGKPLRKITLGITPCLLKFSDSLVLIDTGFDPAILARASNAEWKKPEIEPTAQLKDHGIDLADISDVILTHLHDDHASGILDSKSGESVYPNARIHLQGISLEQGFAYVKKVGEQFVSKAVLDFLQKSDQTVLHEGNWELSSQLRVSHCGGHTPGHQIVYAGVVGKDLLLAGDLLPMRVCFTPDFETSSDVDPQTAAKWRSVLTKETGDRTWFLYHAWFNGPFYKHYRN